MTQRLSLEQTRAALRTAAQTVIDNQAILTKADQAIGDGDHGLGMARGFAAFRDALDRQRSERVGDLFKAGGQAIIMTSGGASGVIFGTLFTGGAKHLDGGTLDAPMFAAALAGGLDAVKARGQAKPGDKTVLDALAPAAAAARDAAQRGEGMIAVAAQVAQAAEAGLEATRSMVAKMGKAKSLGDRSLGFVDPGALTLSLFLRSFSDDVRRLGDTGEQADAGQTASPAPSPGSR